VHRRPRPVRVFNGEVARPRLGRQQDCSKPAVATQRLPANCYRALGRGDENGALRTTPAHAKQYATDSFPRDGDRTSLCSVRGYCPRGAIRQRVPTDDGRWRPSGLRRTGRAAAKARENSNAKTAAADRSAPNSRHALKLRSGLAAAPATDPAAERLVRLSRQAAPFASGSPASHSPWLWMRP
jgi:hypothetical protein